MSNARLAPLVAVGLVALAACAPAPPDPPPQPTAPPSASPAASLAASSSASSSALPAASATTAASASASSDPAKPPASANPALLAPPHQHAVDRMIYDAENLMPTVKTDGAKLFLSRAKLLPKVPTRALLRTPDKQKIYTEADAAKLPQAERAALQPYPADEEVYYSTHYGSPLSYSRPLDILFSRGITIGPKTKLLDFGYGYVGHLRMFATMGVQATGVDVNPLLRPLYSMPGDQGPITGPLGEKGNIRLIDGYFPSDAKTVKAVGSGYDLIISKNTLKHGYIHPERPTDEKKLVHLGVSDEAAIKAFFNAMAPGAYFLIYNICPAPTPPDKPYIPWSDGRSPWTRAQWEAGGFEVVVFDQDDIPAVQAMGKILGWDLPEDGEPGWDIQNDISVLYTLVRRPPKK